MKTIKSILWISVASLVLLLFIVEQQNKNHKLTDSPSKKDWQEPNDWFFNQRAYPSTNIDLKSYTKAKQQVLEMRKTKQNPLEFEYVEVPNISGRVVDIEMFDGDENKILVGTASGGVFVTENNGISWEAITDDIQSLSIGDIAIAPSNQDILYVGTGEPNAGGGSLAYDGTGIYKSLDQGETWNPTNLDYNGSISRIVVDSENPDIAYAGLMGRLFENDSERGLYRTIDGGDTWEKTLYIDDSTGVIDIVMDPFDNSTLYCATWTRVRRPSFRDYGGIGSGIYKSTDGGISWSLLSNFPNNTENLGRIGLAISKSSSPAKLYAIYSSGDGPLLGFSSSEDGGENWIEHNIGDIENVPFMWWFGSPVVDPSNENKVFYPGFDLQYTTSGGNNWNETSTMHVDQHTVFIHPDNPDLVLAGNDGGIYKSTDGGQVFTKLLGLPNLQFYTCEVAPQNINHIYGGSQDNSTIRTLENNGTGWSQILGGDGFVVQVDPEDSNIVYAEWQRGRFYKSANGGNSMSFSLSGVPNSALFNWKTPYVINPNNSNELLIGAERVYKSVDKADNWTSISNDLSGNPDNSNLNYGTITSLDISAANDAIYIAGTDNGRVHISTSGGDDWSLVSQDLPKYWVTSVQADPDVEGMAYVSFSGYRYGNDEGYIYRTFDNGESWENITGNLPLIPVNEIMKIPGQELLVVATDVGVFTSPSDFINWELSSQNLPVIVCTDLDYRAFSNTLTVATYGRGIYQADLTNYVATENEQIVETNIFPNPTADYLNIESSLQFDRVDLYDMHGKLIQQWPIHKKKKISIDISNILKGNYVIQISDNHRLLSTETIIKL